jgi:hypothetical protein
MYKLQRIRVLQLKRLKLFPANDASHVFHISTISFGFAEEHNKQSAYNGTGEH